MLWWVGPVSDCHITVKELVPIVIAAAIWGHQWRGKRVKVHCDNMAVVYIVNHGSSKNPDAMHLARCLAFIAAKREFLITATHIKGADNVTADALSRNRYDIFRSFHPQANQEATPVPESILDSLILSKADWMSRHWTDRWNSIFKTD